MALARHDHVVITVKAALGWFARDMRGQCCKAGPLPGLAFLAAETTAHAAALTNDLGIGNSQHLGHAVLHFRGMLRGGMHHHSALFTRNGKRNLALKIEVLLSAHME